jgi:ATP-dependent 26S proteasome regulatory subunit
MDHEAVIANLPKLLHVSKVRILIEGPAQCGKTYSILAALKSTPRRYFHLTVLSLYSNPVVSPASIAERHITAQELLFLDDAETIFPARDIDFAFLDRFLSRKPNVIAACRSVDNVHPFLVRYLNVSLKMIPRFSGVRSRVPTVTFADIGGCSAAKQALLLAASWCVSNDAKVRSWGLEAASGAILYGPPGTGKTLLAKAAAHACQCSFFSVAIPDLLRCEVGESEKQLTRLFELARVHVPAIVFIDEVQALFGKRDEQKGDANRLVVQLIAQLDQNVKQGKVFSLAATNALDAVDRALLQPGRFEEIIEMGLPTLVERDEILRIALAKLRHEAEIDDRLSELAKITDRSTASEIVGLSQKAAMRALMGGRNLVAFADLKSEIDAYIFKRAQFAGCVKLPS